MTQACNQEGEGRSSWTAQSTLHYEIYVFHNAKQQYTEIVDQFCTPLHLLQLVFWHTCEKKMIVFIAYGGCLRL